MLRLRFAGHGVPWADVLAMDKVDVEKALVMMERLDKERYEMEKAAAAGGIAEILKAVKR